MFVLKWPSSMKYREMTFFKINLIPQAKQQMCFNKYNASIEIVHKDSEIERGQFFCALSCISTDPLKVSSDRVGQRLCFV